MSSAVHAAGTTLTWNSQVVAKLKTINGIELSVDMVDVTTHDSSNYFKEFVPGMIDTGEVTGEGLFDSGDTAGQHAMLTDCKARTQRTVIITFPVTAGTTWTFTGYLTKLKIGDAPIDGAIPFTFSIKPTGVPSLAVSTSAGLTTPFFSISESAVVVPAASGSVYTYVASVLTGVTSVTVTPTVAAGVITVNGSVVASGVPSSAITLGGAGSITTITIIVTETNKAPKTYSIYLTRAST